jgi:phosphohistidine phosphatase
MLELILMRHAEAASSEISADDYQRPLTANGAAAATRAARTLLVEHGPPECILCSPALRTLATAQLLQQTMNLSADLIATDNLIYLATGKTLRRVLAATDGTITRLLLVGHNPGVSQLLANLSPAHAQHSLATAEYACLPLPIKEWSELRGS